MGARITVPGLGAYQAAKFAVRGFSLVLAQEMAPLGVKVTTIEPGGIRTDWAGSSMKIPPISAPYEQTVGTFAKMIRESSGHQSSDPAKIASLIVGLANRDDAPAELLVGVDAVDYVKRSDEAVTENDRKWHDLSITITAD